MKLNYKFSNLLGTVYHTGNLVFGNDSVTLLSPVGNRISAFNLRQHLSETLPIESRFNISCLALDKDCINLFVVNENGEGLFINLHSKAVLFRHRFNKVVTDLKFSPDGKRLAVCRDTDVQIFRSPDDILGCFNPLYLEQVYHIASESTTCIQWSDDSKIFAVGAKDMQTRVCGAQRYDNMFMYTLAGHSGAIVACFFELDSFDLYTLDRNGFLVVWECGIDASQLVPKETPGRPENVSTVDADILMEQDIEDDKGVVDKKQTKENVLYYKKLERHSFHDAVPGAGVFLTAAAYHKKNRLLVTGFSNGAFVLHEMPDFNMIHNLSISEHPIRSVAVNNTGDWIAIGCAALGQLLVWEWQSETYVLKQQGHFSNMQCLAYSTDALYLATGGQDSKVKVWDTRTGFCFVTFTEHTAAITGVAWTQSSKALLSASLDGTVRAFDLKRYRNFRTFTSHTPAQFSCLAVDTAGELICAGSQDSFNVYLWSMKTGRLLEVLSGHEAPVSGVSFHPREGTLISCSWDKTLRFWDVYDGQSSNEKILLSTDVLAVQLSPDGSVIAAATLDCHITMFDWRERTQIGQIDGWHDLDPGRSQKEQITAQKSRKAKAFTNLSFSPEGEFLLAGGQSRHVCLYHVKSAIMVRKFTVSCNLSLDAVADDVDPRSLSEFGSLALMEPSSSDDDAGPGKRKINLPGTKTADPGHRRHRPEIRVMCTQFSPEGRSFSACTTEGVVIYSVDEAVLFDPIALDQSVTVDGVRNELHQQKDYSHALMMALKLSGPDLIAEVVENIPVSQVELISEYLPLLYVERLLNFLAERLKETKHIELYMRWVHDLLRFHMSQLKPRATEMAGIIAALQHTLTRKRHHLVSLHDFNNYSLKYILRVQQLRNEREERRAEIKLESEPVEEEEDESDEELMMQS